MAATKDLLRAQPQRFRAFTEHVLLRLLAAARDVAREVATSAEEVRPRTLTCDLPLTYLWLTSDLPLTYS